jgi:hypothetical protein
MNKNLDPIFNDGTPASERIRQEEGAKKIQDLGKIGSAEVEFKEPDFDIPLPREPQAASPNHGHRRVNFSNIVPLPRTSSQGPKPKNDPFNT